MCGGKGGTSSTVTNKTSIDPDIKGTYLDLIKRGTQVSNTPYPGYGGQLVAGFNPTQTGAFNAINQASTAYQPYFSQAQQYAQQGASPITPQVFSPEALQQYENPYTSDVINASLGISNQQNEIAQRQLMDTGIGAGNAFGGDR